jgi:hypothetical protein
MKRSGLAAKAVWAAGILAAVLLCGCPAATSESSKSAAPGKEAIETTEKVAEKAEKVAEKAEKVAEEAKEEAKEAVKVADEAKKEAKETKKEAKEAKTEAEEAERVTEEAKKQAEEAVKAAEEAREEAKEAKKQAEEAKATTAPEEKPAARKQLDLGSPLVDDVKTLTRLDPTLPVWLDKQSKQVVFLAASCRADWPLEFFATLPDRSYESVVVTDVRPSIVHTGLLALGAKPGKAAQFDPTYTPPSGTRIDIEVRWKDKEGKVQKAPAQQWIRDVHTKKPMSVSWVFAGSGFRKDPETGRDRYLADGGDFITVLNLPTAMLDVPVESVRTMEARSYEGFVENMPPTGTPVTVVLKPAPALDATDVPDVPAVPRH